MQWIAILLLLALGGLYVMYWYIAIPLTVVAGIALWLTYRSEQKRALSAEPVRPAIPPKQGTPSLPSGHVAAPPTPGRAPSPPAARPPASAPPPPPPPAFTQPQQIQNYTGRVGSREELSKVGAHTSEGVLKCSKCGSAQFTAKRSVKGKTIGGAAGVVTLGV